MRQLDRHGALHLYGSPVAKFIDRQSDRQVSLDRYYSPATEGR